MQPGWVRWIAYSLLAALVVVTSCQAMGGTVPGGAGSTARIQFGVAEVHGPSAPSAADRA